MTPSINEIYKETVHMSNTRSTSLPANIPNVRLSSLPNIPNIRSTSLPTKLASLPTNLSNEMSSSLPSFTSDETRKIDDNEKNSRRYGTYDLNWNNLENSDIHIDLEDSVQDINSTIPDSMIIQPSSSFPSIISPQISPIAEINNDDDYINDENQFSPFGGITVTTVKVVQIDDRHTEKRVSKIPLSKNKILGTKEINNTYNLIKRQLTIKTSNNNNSGQTIKERRKTRIYNNVKHDDFNNIKLFNNNDRKFNGVIRRTSSKRRSGVTHYRKSYKRRQVQPQEIMVPAPTSNPFFTNDPTDMEGDDFVQSPIMKGFPWIPVTNGPPKLLHASLIPLNQIITKKAETTSSIPVPRSNKIKRKQIESVSAPIPKRPSQIFRENLLEQSVAMSLNETIMGRNVFASQPIQPIQPAPAPRSKTRKSKRTLVESISAPKPKRPSQIFRENLLEQSVAMSLNETAMGRNVFASQTTQPTHEPEQERVESILAPKPKRPSQLFRENLLEQSVAMSLDNTIMGRNVFATHRQSLDINTSKIPRRRFSRRGSNAKFRKEKAEKNKKKKNTKDDADIVNQEQQLKRTAVNPMVISKILGADELKTKVEEELRKKAVLHPPQPPPRRFTQSAAELRREVNVQKRSKSARPDKRSAKTEPSYRESIEPFPTHLSHESIHPPFTAYIIPSA